MGIGDEDFYLCRGNSDTLAAGRDHVSSRSFQKEENYYETGNV